MHSFVFGGFGREGREIYSSFFCGVPPRMVAQRRQYLSFLKLIPRKTIHEQRVVGLVESTFPCKVLFGSCDVESTFDADQVRGR